MFVLVLLGILGICSAIDINLAKEGTCLSPPPKTKAFNLAPFLDKSVTLYLPLLSKYDMYRQIEDLVGEAKFTGMTEKDVDKSCLAFGAENQNSFCTWAYDGFRRCYEMKAGTKDSIIWKAKGHEDWDGESFVTKASNDYFLTVNCWANGQRSFAVNSLKKILPAEDMSELEEHLKSLGFNPEYFYRVSYKNCPSDDSKRKEL